MEENCTTRPLRLIRLVHPFGLVLRAGLRLLVRPLRAEKAARSPPFATAPVSAAVALPVVANVVCSPAVVIVGSVLLALGFGLVIAHHLTLTRASRRMNEEPEQVLPPWRWGPRQWLGVAFFSLLALWVLRPLRTTRHR